MKQREFKYPIEECARLGTEWYERDIRAKVEEGNLGRIVAIDIETGTYAVADTPLDACHAVHAQLPDAQLWTLRIGYPSVYHFGARFIPKQS